MKKILLLALTLILSVTLISVLSLKSTSFIADEGYIVTSDEALNLILRNDVDLNNVNDRKVSLTHIDELSSVYETINGTYVTEDRLSLNTDFPMHLASGNVVRTFSDKSYLIDTSFNTITTYDGLYLSRGSSFNSGGSLADLEEFIFTCLSNGLFLNNQEIIVNDNVITKIKMNSYLHLDINKINYLEFVKGHLVYNTIRVSEDTEIRVGNNIYTYLELYHKLNDIRENLHIVNPSLPAIDINSTLKPFDSENQIKEEEKEHNVRDEKKDLVDLGETEVPKAQEQTREDAGIKMDSQTEGAESGSVSVELEIAKPYVIFDGVIEPSVYFAKTNFSVNDKFGLIKGGVKFLIYDEHGNLYLRKSMYESGDVILEVLEPEKTYKLEVMYSYTNMDKNLEEVYVTPEGGISFTTLSRNNLSKVDLAYENPTTDGTYPIYFSTHVNVSNIHFPGIDPLVVNPKDNVTSGTYSSLNTSLNRKPSTRGLKLSSDGKVLEETVINYIDRIDLILTKVGTNETFIFKIGSSELDELKKGQQIDYSTPKTLTYSTYFNYSFKLYDQFGGEIKQVDENKSLETHTCKNLPTVSLRMESYQLKNVQMALKLNNLSEVSLNNTYFEVVRESEIDKENFERERLEGKITYVDRNTKEKKEVILDSSDNTYNLQDILDQEEVKLIVNNFDFGEAYIIRAYSTFDLEDGLQIDRPREILNRKFVTADISEIGQAFFDYTNIKPDQNGVSFNIRYNKQTSFDLIKLVDKIEFNITNLETDKEENLHPIKSFEFNKKDFSTFDDTKLRDTEFFHVYNLYFEEDTSIYGGVSVDLYYPIESSFLGESPFEIFKNSVNQENIYIRFEILNNLMPKTKYAIDITTLVYAPSYDYNNPDESKVYDVSGEVKNDINVFKTLKRDAWHNFDADKAIYTTDFAVFYFDEETPMVTDIDGAIIGGEKEGVLLQLFSKNNDQLLFTDYINTNEHVESYTLKNLDPLISEYYLKIYGSYYNTGYDEEDNEQKLLNGPGPNAKNIPLDIVYFDTNEQVRADIKLNGTSIKYENGMTYDQMNVLYQIRHNNPNEILGTFEEKQLYNSVEKKRNDNYALYTINVKPGEKYAFFNNIYYNTGWYDQYSGRIDFFRDNGSHYSFHNAYSASATFVIPNDVTKMTINVLNKAIDTAFLLKLDDGLILNSNSKDISDEVKVLEEGYFFNYNYGKTEDKNFGVTDYIPVKENTFYIISNVYKAKDRPGLSYFNYDGVFMYNDELTPLTKANITANQHPKLYEGSFIYVPTGIKYIRFNMQKGDDGNYLKPKIREYLTAINDSETELEIDFDYHGVNFKDSFVPELILSETHIELGEEVTNVVETYDISINSSDNQVIPLNEVKMVSNLIKDREYEYGLFIRMKPTGQNEGRLIKLDSVKVVGGEIITAITDERELQRVLFDPMGKFVVNNDMTIVDDIYNIRQVPNTNSTSFPLCFSGTLDFGGHTIKRVAIEDLDNKVTKPNSYFIHTIGKKGTIKNLNFVANSNIPVNSGGFVAYNHGLIENIAYTVNYIQDGLAVIDNTHGMVVNNYQSGVISNFVVRVESFKAFRASSLVASNNYGLIENGYVYGATINTSEGTRQAALELVCYDEEGNNFRDLKNDKYSYNVGAIAGNNYYNGKIDNVYSALDIIIDEPLIRDDASTNRNSWARGIRTIAGGTDNGITSNAYSVGSVIIRTIEKVGEDLVETRRYSEDTFNPVVQTTFNFNLAYYTNDPWPYGLDHNFSSVSAPYFKRDINNVKIDPKTLKNISLATAENIYDYTWHMSYLDSQVFNIKNNVLNGQLPTLNMGEKMSAVSARNVVPISNYVKDKPNHASVIYKSSSVIKQAYDYADIRISFFNPSEVTVTGLKFDNIVVDKILKQEKVMEDYIVEVRVKVDKTNPLYRSRYQLLGVTGTYPSGNEYISENFSDEAYYVTPKFYRSVKTPEEFFAIYDTVVSSDLGLYYDREGSSIVGNYRIEADLDFSEYDKLVNSNYHLADNLWFTGELDGAKYELIDGEYVMTGLHTLSNIHMDKVNKPFFIGSSFYGTMSNLVIDNFTSGNTPYNVDAGFIRVANREAIIDNVHIRNSKVIGNGNVGALVAYVSYATIENSSSSNNIVEGYFSLDASTGGIGGLVGRSFNGKFYNNYTSNCEVINYGINDNAGTGALIGWCDGTVIENCYTNSYVNSNTINVGGIVGRTNNSTIKRCYSTSTLFSGAYSVGGIVGDDLSATSGMEVHNNLALGMVSTKVQDVQDLNPIVGREDAVHIYDQIHREQENFAYKNFSINGMPFLEFRFKNELDQYGNVDMTKVTLEEFIERTGVTTVLTRKQLMDPNTYKEIIGFGDYYDYTNVESGVLPKLKDTRGNLLYGQEDIGILESYPVAARNIEIDASMEHTDPRMGYLDKMYVTIQMPKKQFNVSDLVRNNLIPKKSIKIDGMNFNPEAIELVDAGNNQLGILFKEVNIVNYYDSYLLSFRSSPAGIDINSHVYIKFSYSLEKVIVNIYDWQKFFSNEKNRYTYNNIVLEGDIDFKDVEKPIYNVKVNNVSTTGNMVAIKNVDEEVVQRGFSIFNEITGDISNINFENIKIKMNKNIHNFYVGLIGQLYGNMNNVNFNNINFEAKSNHTNHETNYIGCISRSFGDIKNVSLSNVNISIDALRAQHVGLLVGMMMKTTNISNITVTPYNNNGVTTNNEISFTNKTRAFNVGGVIGYGYINSDQLFMDKSDISGITITNAYNVGGVIGTGSSSGGHGRLGDVNVSNIKISFKGYFGKDNITANYFGGFGGHYIQSNDLGGGVLRMKDIDVRAVGYYVGGAVGYGNYLRNVIIQDAVVAGIENVGGIGNSHLMSCLADNVTVTGYEDGSHNIGGLVGYRAWQSVYDSACINSTIGYNPTIERSVVSDNVGGIYGYQPVMYRANIHRASSINNKVVGGENVGGIIGYGGQYVLNCLVVNNEIIGETNVGGVSGRQALQDIYRTQVDNKTTVTAKKENAGGVVGLIDNTSESDFVNNDNVILKSIIAGPVVKGENNVAGFVGKYIDNDDKYIYVNNSGNEVEEMYGIIFTGDLFLTNNGFINPAINLYLNDETTPVYRNVHRARIHKYSVINDKFASEYLYPNNSVIPQLIESPEYNDIFSWVSADQFARPNQYVYNYYEKSIDYDRYLNYKNIWLLEEATIPKIENVNSKASLVLTITKDKETPRSVLQYDKVTEDSIYTLSTTEPVKWYKNNNLAYSNHSDYLLKNASSTSFEVAGAGYYYGISNSGKYTPIFHIDIPTYLPLTMKDGSQTIKGFEGVKPGKIDIYNISDDIFYDVNDKVQYNGIKNYVTRPNSDKLINSFDQSSYSNIRLNIEESPHVDVYATGIDTVNIEFSGISKKIDNLRIVQNDVVYPLNINGRAITIKYDFKDDFKVEYEYLGNPYYREISAKDVRRTIDTYLGNYYYLDGSKVGNKDGSYGSAMIHLFNNHVINKDGFIYDIDTRESVNKFDQQDLFKEVSLVPLYSGEFEGMKLDTFLNYTISDDNYLEYPIVLINDETYGLLTSDVSKQGFIIKNDIVYYLESNGKVTQFDVGEINKPDGLLLTNVKEMTDTYDSNSNLVLLRYENGVVAGFNFVTGTRLEFKTDEPQISLKEFAKSSKTEPTKSNLAEKYAKTESVHENILNDEVASSTISTIISTFNNKENVSSFDPKNAAKEDIDSIEGMESSQEGLTPPSKEKETNKEQVSNKEKGSKKEQESKKESSKKDGFITLYNNKTGEFELHDKVTLLSSGKENSINVKEVFDSMELQKQISPKPNIGERLVATIANNEKKSGLTITLISLISVVTLGLYIFTRRNK